MDMRDTVCSDWCRLERRCCVEGVGGAPGEGCEEGGCHLHTLGECMVKVSLGDGGIVCGHRVNE